MTQATANQSEEFGAIKENVRHNEKAIDEVKADLKAFRSEVQSEFKDVRADIETLNDKIKLIDDKIVALSQRFDSLGWKALLGIFVIVAANVVLKLLP